MEQPPRLLSRGSDREFLRRHGPLPQAEVGYPEKSAIRFHDPAAAGAADDLFAPQAFHKGGAIRQMF
jgi:hypothetical protein